MVETPFIPENERDTVDCVSPSNYCNADSPKREYPACYSKALSVDDDQCGGCECSTGICKKIPDPYRPKLESDSGPCAILYDTQRTTEFRMYGRLHRDGDEWNYKYTCQLTSVRNPNPGDPHLKWPNNVSIEFCGNKDEQCSDKNKTFLSIPSNWSTINEGDAWFTGTG